MIPFIDLKSQQSRIRSAVDKRFSEILDHCRFIEGPEINELESQIASLCGAKHALSCSNGTDALILALMLKGIGPGDSVIVPAWTFVATAEAVAILGATPFFVDVDPDTFNINPASVEKVIQLTKRSGLNLKGIISVGIFGQPADMDSLRLVAKDHRLWILDDVAQSFGATYKDRNSGNLADISATSFFPAKPLGCYGDGGAVFTNSDQDIETLRSLRVHGQGSHKYENVRIGMTGRLETFQAAVLLEKLKIFPEELQTRQKIAERYSKGLKDAAVVPYVMDECTPSWAVYTVKVNPQSRAEIMDILKEAGVPSAIYYSIPLHEQKAYSHCPRAEERLKVCEQLSHEVLSLPIHPYLTEKDQDYIIETFHKAVDKAAKSAA